VDPPVAVIVTPSALQALPLGPAADDPPRAIAVLYAFCGAPRPGDLAKSLAELNSTSLQTTVEEFDLVRGTDLLSVPLVQSLVGRILKGEFQAVVASPPCSSWSRLQWANDLGPRPVRSWGHPLGFPWLSKEDRVRAETGNDLLQVAIDMMTACAKAGALGVLEHPEDLGVTPMGRPASIWQLPDVRELGKVGFKTGVLHQSDYGAGSPKPTRFMANKGALAKAWRFGWPHFHEDGRYAGPLGLAPPGFDSMVKMPGDTEFKSTNSAAYPPALCQLLAREVVRCAPTTCGWDGVGAGTDSSAPPRAPAASTPTALVSPAGPPPR
jgi:hypothetical protein